MIDMVIDMQAITDQLVNPRTRPEDQRDIRRRAPFKQPDGPVPVGRRCSAPVTAKCGIPAPHAAPIDADGTLLAQLSIA